LREIVEERLDVVMNKRGGPLWMKLKSKFDVDAANKGKGGEAVNLDAAVAAPAITTTATAVTTGSTTAPLATMPKITPSLAFKLSDADGNGELTMEEFQNLLEDLGLNISESRALRMFASADRGNGGTITYNEFLNVWRKLENVIISDALRNTGLSKQSIIQGLVACFVVLFTLFVFLFLSVSAFGGAGSFGATVRASMALAASKLGSTVGFKVDPSKRTIAAAARKSLRVFLGGRR
jgi:hypothetical protein